MTSAEDNEPLAGGDTARAQLSDRGWRKFLFGVLLALPALFLVSTPTVGGMFYALGMRGQVVSDSVLSVIAALIFGSLVVACGWGIVLARRRLLRDDRDWYGPFLPSLLPFGVSVAVTVVPSMFL